MNVAPFLPGLILALAVWITPLPIQFLPEHFVPSIEKRFPWAVELAPWLQSLGLPYAGLILGWISARDYGLTGQAILEWVLGAAAAILLGLILGGSPVDLPIRAVGLTCKPKRAGPSTAPQPGRW